MCAARVDLAAASATLPPMPKPSKVKEEPASYTTAPVPRIIFKKTSAPRKKSRLIKESFAIPAYLPRAEAKTEPAMLAKKELGQFPTPMPVANFMASLFVNRDAIVRLLDAGAGTGTLIQAFVERRCTEKPLPRSIC